MVEVLVIYTVAIVSLVCIFWTACFSRFADVERSVDIRVFPLGRV